MRNLALVVISIIAVIALLDVAASLVFNGSVNIPPLLVLVVAVAMMAHVVTRRSVERLRLDQDPRDLMTLVRLRLHAAALARHTAILTDRIR